MWKHLLASLAAILSFHGFSGYSAQAQSYTFVKEGTEAPTVSYYDYIIIGGGTVGCPLATTLSESSKVLLLERGGSPYGNNNITNVSTFMDTLCDLSPTSASQRFVSEDGVANARARVLGGGTCLNAGLYSRASSEFVREAGWDEALVNQSYRWVESKLVHEPRLGPWQSAVIDGLLEAGVTPYNGFTFDHLYGTKIAGTIFDSEGHRHTAADLLQHANPDGITVFLHATVHRILFKDEGKLKPTARGVIFMDASGTEHRAYLNERSKNEIILSAGAIGSPQLLMLSGIGPVDHLKSFGIEVVMDQPMVGQGMSDNPLNVIFIPSPLPVEISLAQLVGITQFGSYIESISGAKYFVCPSYMDPHDQIWGMLASKTSKLSLMGNDLLDNKVVNGIKDSHINYGFIVEKVAYPTSTGHLELRNKNPNDNPRVTFNYFKEREDLKVCVKGIKAIERVILSKSFSKFVFDNMSMETLLNMTASFLSNMQPRKNSVFTSLEQYCKDTVMTIWHYHGGCQVGQVVDHDYKVLGMESLRIIDGSTFTTSPGTNPQATLMMLGRYMGVKIRNKRYEEKVLERVRYE